MVFAFAGDSTITNARGLVPFFTGVSKASSSIVPFALLDFSVLWGALLTESVFVVVRRPALIVFVVVERGRVAIIEGSKKMTLKNR
jgi:hypothetical protein